VDLIPPNLQLFDVEYQLAASGAAMTLSRSIRRLR
jgi:hypothetical protein